MWYKELLQYGIAKLTILTTVTAVLFAFLSQEYHTYKVIDNILNYEIPTDIIEEPEKSEEINTDPVIVDPKDVSLQTLIILTEIDFEDVFEEACARTNCKYIKQPHHKNFLKKYYIPALYTIIEHESGFFRYNKGLYAEDYCYAQLHKNTLKILNIKPSQVMQDYKLCIRTAMLVWFMNIEYGLRLGVKPKTIVDYMAMYHSIKPRNYYKRKLRKLVWKNINRLTP